MKRLFLFLSFALVVFLFFYNPPFLQRFLSHLFSEEKEKEWLTLYGNVDIRQVDLGFRVSGRVLSMPFQEGDLVEKGTLMAWLDKQPYEDLVLQARAHIQSVEASLENAAQLVARRKFLIGTGGISEQDIDDAIAAEKIYRANLKEAKASLGVALTNLQDTELYAPDDGTILTRIREVGTVVREADPIYTLSLISPIWVRTYVSERDLSLIYPGMPAEVYTDRSLFEKEGQKPLSYQGHIGFISPVAEFTPKTVETTKLRTDLVYRLRVIVDNPDRELKQGMPVTVKLALKYVQDEKK